MSHRLAALPFATTFRILALSALAACSYGSGETTEATEDVPSNAAQLSDAEAVPAEAVVEVVDDSILTAEEYMARADQSGRRAIQVSFSKGLKVSEILGIVSKFAEDIVLPEGIALTDTDRETLAPLIKEVQGSQERVFTKLRKTYALSLTGPERSATTIGDAADVLEIRGITPLTTGNAKMALNQLRQNLHMLRVKEVRFVTGDKREALVLSELGFKVLDDRDIAKDVGARSGAWEKVELP